MGDYSKRLRLRAATQDGEQLEGVQVTIDLRLIIHRGARVIEYQLTPDDAIDLGEHLVKRGAEARRGTEGRPLVGRHIAARVPSDSTGYPVVLCTDARVPLEEGITALDFSPGSVELPASGELALLWQHDGRCVIGIVRGLRNCGNRLEGLAYFASTPFAQKIRKGVDSGQLTCVSQGYTVIESRIAPWGWQVTRWRPHELSICQQVGGDPGATIRPSSEAMR
jgi:hypothetical protein